MLRRSLRAVAGIARLAPLAALGILAIAAAKLGRDSATRAETLYLALWTIAVLLPLALLAARRPTAARSPLGWAPGAAALAVGLVLVARERHGAGRPALVALLLAVALALVATRSLRLPALRQPMVAAALALSTALLAHGHLLFVAPAALSTWLQIAVLPAFAAVIAGSLARRRLAAASAVGVTILLAPLLARDSWLVWTALLILLLFQQRPAGRWLFGSAIFLILLAGGFPWLRTAPLSSIFGTAKNLAAAPPGGQLAGRSAVLDLEHPEIELELATFSVRAVALDSYLTNSAALPCGTRLAHVELEGTNGRFETDLVVGRDSAEWASDRPDVRARLACRPPAPWVSWIPSQGRFFGRTSRARFDLPRPIVAKRLRIARHAALPDDLSIAFFRVAVER